MKTRDLVSSAARALRANMLRSALTALGVIIGVASVVAMVALGSGAPASVERSIASLGSNLLIVVPGASNQGGNVRSASGSWWNALKVDDAEAIRREIPGVTAVAHSQRTRAQLVAPGANWNATVEGVTPAYLIARDWEVAEGRFFEESENNQARKVVVLGQTTARELFANADPLGQTVRINNATFEVIGIMAPKGQSGVGQDQDDLAIAPFNTVKRRISGRVGSADSVSQISVKAESEAAMPRVQEDITELLRQRHRIRPGEADDFTVQNLSSISEAMQQTVGTFTGLIAGVAGVSLLVGGIGIMNIMLVSVTERTREIGLRKALGARRDDILHQFGLEAVTLSVLGGVVGLILGGLLAWGITAAMKLPLVLGYEAAVAALAVSAGVGIVFGIYPAFQAARLNPIDALRRE